MFRDEEGTNRNRFPTRVYERELVQSLPDVRMTLKLNAHVDPLNIDVIYIDFNKFQPVIWCNPMSKWHWYLKYPKISSDDPLTFTGKNLQWANISTNIKVSDVKMTSRTLLRRIMHVVLYYFYRTINLINRWTVRPTPIMKPEHRTTKQTSAKETPL